MSRPDTLTYDEAATSLGVSVRWLRKQSARGLITFYWLGSRKVCDRADLEDLPARAKDEAERKAKVPVVRSRPKASKVEAFKPGEVEVDDDIRNWVTRRAAA